MLRVRLAFNHRTGTVELAADVRPDQPHRAQLASAIGSEARAQEDVAVDLEVATVQGGARRVGDGGAGAVHLAADVRPGQPHRAQLAIAVGGEARAQEDTAGDLQEPARARGQKGS